MILHYIKLGLLLLILGIGFPLLAPAQDIGSLSPSGLPFGSYVAGLYHLEADDGGGLYLKEQANGTLTAAALDTSDSAFYFWLVENVYEDYFQLYSATQQGKLMQINADGSVQWTTDATTKTSKLLFRMYLGGSERTAADQGVVARGYITTGALSEYYGNEWCRCNFLISGTNNSRFSVHDSNIQAQNYRPVVFESTDDQNVWGTIETDNVNNVTRITQSPPLMEPALPRNFVSSNFFVGGFGEDDFQITVSPGAEGYIGFLDYTDHHYTKNVYKNARPRIGIKIANDVISLIYRSGDQPLSPSGTLIREKLTNFVPGVPFTLGFKNQDSLVVAQNGLTYTLERTAPAESFFNRSVTQSARMLVQLVKDTVEIAYTTKNRLINSEDDLGTDNGSALVSTDAFLPYNEGDSLVNTFDWQETKWKVRYAEGVGTITDIVPSPYYEDLFGISANFDGFGNYLGGEDFARSEGWELIKADLGYNADGFPYSGAPHHPYVMMYNRISGLLRVFVYVNNNGEANHLTVILLTKGGTPNNAQGYTPRLWGSLQQFASLDEVENSAYSRVIPFYSSSGRSWYSADFVMEYDPCITFFESTVELQVQKTTQGELTMIGRMEGGGIPAGTTEYSNWQNQRQNFLMGVMDNDFGILENTLGDITMKLRDDFNLMDFQTEVEGTLTGAAIEPWEKEAARIEWQAQQTIGRATIAEGVATIAGGAAQAAGSPLEGVPFASGVSEAVQGVATIAAGAAQITAGEAELRLASASKMYYDAIKDKVREDDQDITMAVPEPRPHLIFGEMAVHGTLNIVTSLLMSPKPYIASPGGLNSDNAPEWYAGPGSRGSQPLYNKPMGKFTLLKKPQFAIGVVKHENSPNYKAWLKIKEKPYFAHNNTALGKIDDMLSLSIQVQTIDVDSIVQSNITGKAYTNLFEVPDSNALPGEMDISDLIDWAQIEANIATLTDPSAQDIKNKLSEWIRVSYRVWSLSLSTLKSRNLERVFAKGDQYYTGNSSFAYNNTSTVFGDQLLENAKTQASSGELSGYNFSDDPAFGTTYRVYHTMYDQAGDAFYTAMNNYCIALEAAQDPGAKNTEEPQDVKGEEVVATEEEPLTEELTMDQPGLTVYPNPAKHKVNFRLVSQEKGRTVITLYDLQGSVLIGTADDLDGSSTMQGHVNIASLPAGIYILEVKLPDGRSISKKIIKQ